MKNRILFLPVLLVMLIAVKPASAQITFGFGPATYYFFGSNDNNLHYGVNARLGFDTHQLMIDAGFSIFDNVSSNVKTILHHRNSTNPFDIKTAYNAVNGQSWELNLNSNYYFTGMPEEGKGFYGIVGFSAFYYTQTNNLSSHDTAYFPDPKYIDQAVHSSTQVTFNTGLGAKYSLRHSSIFIEAVVSIPTSWYQDYQYPIENAVSLSVNAGMRITLRSHRNKYQRWNIELNPF